MTANGATVAQALADLNERFPGIRFRMVDEQNRIRRHMTIYVDGERVSSLEAPTAACTELVILQALSGG